MAFQHRGTRSEDTVHGLAPWFRAVVGAELLSAQPLPENAKKGGVWKRRYGEINEWEQDLVDNGAHVVKVVKVVLNLSKREQAKRFLQRIDKTDKDWKFSLSDIQERQYWDHYQGHSTRWSATPAPSGLPGTSSPPTTNDLPAWPPRQSSSAPSPRSTRGIRKSRPRSVTLWRTPAASWWPKLQAERCDGHLTDATSPAAPPLARR